MDKVVKLVKSPVVRALLTALASGGSAAVLGLAHPVTFVVALGGVVLTVTAKKK